MKVARALIVTCLLLIVVSGIAFSSTDAPPGVNPGTDRGRSDISPARNAAESPPGCGCSDIAYTDIFKSKGLGYVTSMEFGMAVRAVVNGDSRYSPSEIPGSWRVAAADWGAFVAPRAAKGSDAAHSTALSSLRPGFEGVELLKDSESCSPPLIYLASLEYRSRVGRPELTPAFPKLVREATHDLVARAEAKTQLAGRFTERAGAIVTKIREAERMGAGDCAPGKLEEAKAEVSRARREAADVRSSVQETESAFLKAEQAANVLLAGQRFALKKGLKCYPE